MKAKIWTGFSASKLTCLCEQPVSATVLSLVVTLATVLLPATHWELALIGLSAYSDLTFTGRALSFPEKVLTASLGAAESSMLLRACSSPGEAFGLMASLAGVVTAMQIRALGSAATGVVLKYKLVWFLVGETVLSPQGSFGAGGVTSGRVCFVSMCVALLYIGKQKSAVITEPLWARAVCEAIPGLAVFNDRFEGIFISQSLKRTAGQREKQFLETTLTTDGKSLKNRVEEMVAKNGSGVETLGVTKLDQEVMAWQGIPVCQGHKTYFALLCTEITALWTSEESARSEVSAKTTLLRSVTHELRTPLNAITNVLQDIVETEHISEECEEKLKIVNTSSKLLLHLVNDILDMSQMMVGQLRVVTVEFSPREVYQDIADLFSFQCQKRGLSLDLDLPLSLPIVVSTDPNRLSQILANLLSNALK